MDEKGSKIAKTAYSQRMRGSSAGEVVGFFIIVMRSSL
jgi:hypothetical protein